MVKKPRQQLGTGLPYRSLLSCLVPSNQSTHLQLQINFQAASLVHLLECVAIITQQHLNLRLDPGYTINAVKATPCYDSHTTITTSRLLQEHLRHFFSFPDPQLMEVQFRDAVLYLHMITCTCDSSEVVGRGRHFIDFYVYSRQRKSQGWLRRWGAWPWVRTRY